MSCKSNLEIALVHHLRAHYAGPKFLRPVAHADDAIAVSLGFAVAGLTINECDGMATVHGFLIKSWTDPNLKWDPSHFGGIKLLRLPCTEFWMPDIMAYQCGEGKPENEQSLAVVSHDGTVLHVPTVTYKVQGVKTGEGYKVTIAIGSWAYDDKRISLKFSDPSGADVSEMTEGPKWHVTSGGVTMSSREYSFGEYKESFPCANYVIDVTKKA